MSDALTTKERMKTRLSLSGTGFDTLLDNLILGVTARIQAMTGRRFVYATYTNELHDGCDVYGGVRKLLILKNGPVDSVTSVEYNTGTDGDPTWTTMPRDLYIVDLGVGALVFRGGMPSGFQNVRVTYTGGYSGFAFGISNFWTFNETPVGDVDGSNLTFTLSEDADQVIVYADGARESSANITHVDGTDTFTLAAGRAPFTSIAVDFQRTTTTSGVDNDLPADLVDVCERAVTYLFKLRDAEGKSAESFGESSITWRESMFTSEMRGTIKNYRRGYSL